MLKKLKLLLADDTLFTSILLCIIAILAFYLGRFSVGEGKAVSVPVVGQAAALPLPIVATTTATTTPLAPTAVTAETARYVGSKSGDKYHLLTCAGAKRIKEENKIYFLSQTDAEAAGYTPAANCPGL